MYTKRASFTIGLVIMLIIGMSLLLYPSLSNYWNSKVQSKALAGYLDEIAVMDEDKYEEIWNAAIAYNEALLARDNQYILPSELQQRYEEVLNVGGTGIMGYVDIPTIHVNLPLYHGTSEKVLQVAIGHLNWTSIPTGGESTHCVISGHRGLPSARLFTDLDKLVVGDYFMIHVLDETMTYEVDQIRIVTPSEAEELLIQEGKDLFTLVTCTPYGINSHRMLVRGHRVENLEDAKEIRITADAMVVEKLLVMPFVLLPILLVMLVFLLIATRKPKGSIPTHDAEYRRNPT